MPSYFLLPVCMDWPCMEDLQPSVWLEILGASQTHSEDISFQCFCMWFPTYTDFPVCFQEFIISCSLWNLLWFSRVFGAATRHQALCSHQSSGFKNRMVPHQHSKVRCDRIQSFRQLPKKLEHWLYVMLFFSFPTKEETLSWTFVCFYNHTKLCWLQGSIIAGKI